MTKEKIIKIVSSFKKGTYHKVSYAKQYDNGVVVFSEIVGRIGIKYRRKENVQPSANKFNGVVDLENIIYTFSNTNKTHLRLFATNNKRLKTKKEYYLGTQQISKEQAISLSKELANKKPRKPSDLFYINIAEIVDIK